MPSQKQKTERAVWKRLRGFLNVPPAQENMAEYMAARRRVDKLVDNPEFVKEARKHFESFGDFLLNYDLNVADLDKFDDLLNMDIYFRRKKK